MFINDLKTWLLECTDSKKFDVYLKSTVDEKGTNCASIADAVIVESICLPDKDILLGFKCSDEDNSFIEYYKLSEINLINVNRDKE